MSFLKVVRILLEGPSIANSFKGCGHYVYLLGIKLCVLKVGVIIVIGVYLLISIKLRILEDGVFIQVSLAMWGFLHAQIPKLLLATMTI